MPTMPPAIDDLLKALRISHDQLAGIAGRLDAAALAAPSYCRDWSRAQVFSHLGSGGEIGLNSLRAALGEAAEADREEIWARWNALPPEGMARGFIEADDRYLTAVEQLDADRQEALLVPFVFGPTPLAGVLTFRLHEHTLHNWDVQVSLDPQASLLPEAVPLLLDLPTATIRWVARPAEADLPGPVRLTVTTTNPQRHYLLTVADDTAELHDTGTGTGTGPGDTTDGATGKLDLPAEAFLRLAAGRLDPDHIPPGTHADGHPTLPQLRTLFPGY
jgi:uncharacterized protein (TIGR03083 family)